MTFDYVAYMRTLAQKNKLLLHTAEKPAFYRVSSITGLEELITSGSFGKNRCLIVLDAREGRFVDNDSDNLLDDQYYTFFVLEHADALDPNKRSTALRFSMIVAKQLLSKMFKDKREAQQGKEPKWLMNLDKASIYYKEIGPIGDNFWGYMYSFSLLEPPGIQYNENDWQ